MPVTIAARVQPKARRNAVLGFHGDVLRLAVTAPPEGDRANAAVVALLAEALGLARTQVRIRRGHASRHKVLEVQGLEEEEVFRRLRPAG